MEDIQNELNAWRVDYNNHRPHSTLGGMAPNRYLEKQAQRPSLTDQLSKKLPHAVVQF
ncbi:MAG: transposase [Bacteroidetes bacterium]|nr:transposase [Bacteroidota bacterium]